MSVLSATFEAVDRMSDVFDSMANSGDRAIEQWERAGSVGDGAFESVTQAATDAAKAMETASQSTDYWTAAVGNYDKGAMEALYSTEELVEAGYKTADALNEQNEMFELCEKSASHLGDAMEAATNIEESLSNAMSEAAETSEKLATADGVSSEAKEELARASETAANAIEELQRAQEEAAAAMDAYDATMMSGTDDLAELEAAAERAGHAAENLAEANGRATAATEELSNATNEAAEEFENSEKSGTEAVNAIASALAAAGITVTVKEIAEAVYELSDAFSEAEKTVVLATGATGEALDSLETSMMNVYAAAKSADLSETAGGIGEINTRLGLTGEKLEKVTSQFLDYANITGQDVVSSVSNVTKVMNNWGVEVDNIEGLMDKLAYAGQMSGISVSNLSNTLVTNRAVLQQVGFGLDESIGLLASLELQGISSQTVMTGLRTAINNFSADGKDASVGLRDVVEQIANMGSESAATALAVDTFGSRAGVALAGSIRNGQLSIDDLAASLSAAGGTLKSTAEASQTLGEKWQQAGNNIKTAFTSATQPAIDATSSRLANLINGFGDMLNKYPAVAKGMTTVGVAIGTATVAFVGYTVATKVATVVSGIFTATLEANPIILVTTAVIGLTAGLAFLAASMGTTEEKVVKLTASAEKQANEIKELEDEYQKLCDAGQETSEEAIYLKYQIDNLTDAFESGKQTLEEYISACDDANTAWKKTLDSNREAFESVSTNEGCYLSLIHRLEELATQSDITVASQEEMKAIIDELNRALPGLSLSYDSVINSAGDFGTAVENMIKAQAAMERYEAAKRGMIDSYNIIYGAEQQLNDLHAQEALELQNNTKLQQQYNDVYEDYIFWINSGGRGTNPYEKRKNELKAALDASNDALESYKTKIGETQETLNDAQADYDMYLETISEIAGVTEDAFNEISSAEGVIDAMATSVGSLAGAYNEAYAEAKKSFDGQFGLFDKAQADASATVSNMQNALNSQLNFWETYAANLDTLKAVSADDLGVTQAQYDKLIALASEGTEQAAGLAQSMANAIKSGNEDSIIKVVNTLDKIEEAKAKAASAAAEWKIDFDGKMDEIVKKAETAINDMNLSPEAEKAATDTMNAYAEAIRTQGATAITNAQSIATQVKAALQNASASINIGVTGGTANVQKNARGTTNAADIFIAGEEGPELVVGYGGATVYNADETDKMLSESRPTPLHTNVPESMTGRKSEDTATKDKRIVLAIEGGGEIAIGSNADKDTALQVLIANLKPTLLELLQEEVFEEGDGTYEY